MKRSLIRVPRYSRTYTQTDIKLKGRYPGPDTYKDVVPQAVNIKVVPSVLGKLEPLGYRVPGRNKTLELLTTKTVPTRKIPGVILSTLAEWKEHSDELLNVCHSIPPAVFSALLEECSNLFYSTPQERRGLLEEIMTGLREESYPITRRVYNSYILALQNMRISPDLDKVFTDLSELKLPLRYSSGDLEERKTSNLVCRQLALRGQSDVIYKCWDTWLRQKEFAGFPGRTFSHVITSHLIRGEIEEALNLYQALEHRQLLDIYIVQSFSEGLALTGELELFDVFLRKPELSTHLAEHAHFITLYFTLIEGECLDHLADLVSHFDGMDFGLFTNLRNFILDLVSRGHYMHAADMLFRNRSFQVGKRAILENEIIPLITQHMKSDLNNILINFEIRGIATQFKFDFDKISLPPGDIEGLCRKVRVEYCTKSQVLLRNLCGHKKNANKQGVSSNFYNDF